MIEILTFIFSGFWVFGGTLLLISCTLGGMARNIAAMTYRRYNDNTTGN